MQCSRRAGSLAMCLLLPHRVMFHTACFLLLPPSPRHPASWHAHRARPSNRWMGVPVTARDVQPPGRNNSTPPHASSLRPFASLPVGGCLPLAHPSGVYPAPFSTSSLSHAHRSLPAALLRLPLSLEPPSPPAASPTCCCYPNCSHCPRQISCRHRSAAATAPHPLHSLPAAPLPLLAGAPHFAH